MEANCHKIFRVNLFLWLKIRQLAHLEENNLFKPIEKIESDSNGILKTKLTLDEISIVMNRNIG